MHLFSFLSVLSVCSVGTLFAADAVKAKINLFDVIKSGNV